MIMPSIDKIRVAKNPFVVFSKGDESAPVKIIEFADLECSACKRAHAKMKTLLERFKDDIYFEYRHFPLPMNRYSKNFSKASICAGEQDKYFEFLDMTYANQGKLGKFKPQEFAEKLTLDIKKFNACFAGQRSQAILDADMTEARRLGIQSTPTFIINGQLIIGAPSEPTSYFIATAK